MNSPFPGMDPYLESRWSDVHVKLIGFIGEAIQPLLPRALRARSEERVLLEESEQTEDDDDRPREYRSDVAVVQIAPQPAEAAAGSTIATVEPVVIRRQPAPPLVHRFVQIIDITSGNRVVTAVEILSPWNKAAGRLNRDYRRKIEDYHRGGVSVVEIDLLRYPPRSRLAVTESEIPASRRSAYVTCVWRARIPDEWRAYPMPLRSALPRIAIPLRSNDPEIGLELQPLIGRVYAASGHDDIDYTKPADPPLDGDDSEWADEILKLAGRR